MDWVRPQCLQEVLGLKPGQPRASKIGPALSSSNTIRRQPSADPGQKHAPAVETAQRKKGIDFQGPVTEAGIRGLTNEWRVRFSRFIFGWRRPTRDIWGERAEF